MLKRSVLAVFLVMGMVLSAGVAKADLSIMKSKFDVTFYGYIKAEAVYHSQRVLGDNYAVFAYPDIEPYEDQNTLSFTARQSRFGFDIAAPGASANSKVLGKIEIDFYGKGHTENKAALMLRRAYVMYKTPSWSLLAGNEWMLMSPLYPHVSNYPAGASIGNLGYRMPQIRFQIGNQFRFAVSAGEKIEGDLTTSDYDAGDRSAVPDFQWQLGYFGKNKLVVAYSGHYGEEMWDDVNTGEDALDNPYNEVTFESWSHNLSVNIPIGKRLALSGEAFYGVNLDGWYTGSIFAQGVGIDEDGDRVPVRDMGGWVELMVKPVDKVTLFLGYGFDEVEEDDLEGGPYPANPLLPGYVKAFSRNQMIYGHMFYDVTKAFRVSFEAMQISTEYLKTDEEDDTDYDADAMRYDLAFWFFF